MAVVVEIIRRYFYVDDGTGGANSVEECKEVCRQLDEAMKLGGLPLSKWKFSHPVLREEGEVEEQEEEHVRGLITPDCEHNQPALRTT